MKYFLVCIGLIVVLQQRCLGQTSVERINAIKLEVMAEIGYDKFSPERLVEKLTPLVGSHDTALRCGALYNLFAQLYTKDSLEKTLEIGSQLTEAEAKLIGEEAAAELLLTKLIDPNELTTISVPGGLRLSDNINLATGKHYYEVGFLTYDADAEYKKLASSLCLVILKSLPSNADVIATKKDEKPFKLKRPTNMQIYLSVGEYELEFRLGTKTGTESITLKNGDIRQVVVSLK